MNAKLFERRGNVAGRPASVPSTDWVFLKVYWDNGAQIISPHDKGIQKSIEKHLQPWTKAWDLDDLDKNTLLIDPTEEVNENYMKIIEANVYDRYFYSCVYKSPFGGECFSLERGGISVGFER